jgi:hypothetical protein
MVVNDTGSLYSTDEKGKKYNILVGERPFE